jgi:hypothetical protein
MEDEEGGHEKQKMRTTRRWKKIRRKIEGGTHLKQGKEKYIYIYS